MNKVFEHADDIHVRARYVYASVDDGWLFEDSAFTNTKKIDKATVKNLFLKGMIIVFNSKCYVPTCYYEDGTGDGAYGAVTVCGDGADYTFFSKEYTT